MAKKLCKKIPNKTIREEWEHAGKDEHCFNCKHHDKCEVYMRGYGRHEIEKSDPWDKLAKPKEIAVIPKKVRMKEMM